ncbi:MAG: hypothetical protein Q4F18_08880, partial [Clostridia bacterium]|nr:hypothetical protein [Clostridia bacterium]
PTPAPTDEPTPVPTVVPALPLRVEAENLTPDVWKNVAPTFTLSGIEQDSEEYVYGVFICDERLVLLSKGTDVYQPEDEGEVHLRFAVLDMMGDVVALSDQYDMLLDFTPPEEPVLNGLEIDGENFAQFPLMDAGSGVDAYSMDGGETWRTPEEGEEIHLFWGAFGDVVDPGRIQVRDKAGNIAMNAEAYTFGEVLFVPSVSTGGGGGGGSGKPAIHHVKETMDYSTVNYNALDLVFSEEPQLELTAGGKSMALTLSGETESGAQPRPFTAVLDTWKTEETDELTAPNALVLRAVEQEPADGETAGDEAVNTWSFTGDVYKLLGNSGVDYLVLQSGEYIVAIPTAGFTAGTQYAKLKASGVSTRKFAYTVCQDEALRETTLSVTVEGETYLLEEDRAQPMYRYDVLIGTRDMMQKPYASYMPDQNQEDNR